LEGGGGNPPQSCVDSAVGEDAGDKPVVPYPCHEQGGNQVKNREREGGGGIVMSLSILRFGLL